MTAIGNPPSITPVLQVKGTVRREHSCTSPLPSDQSPAAARSKELLPMPLSPTISKDWPAFMGNKGEWGKRMT